MQSPSMRRPLLWLLLFFAGAMLLILARWLPLGIPGQFEYPYIQHRYWDPISLLITILPAAGIILTFRSAGGKTDPLSRKELSLALIALTSCSFLFHVACAVLLSPYGFAEAFLHIFQKYGDGAYLLKASEIHRYRGYLGSLEDYLRTQDLAMFPHPSVHPPGFTSFFYLFYWMAEQHLPGVLAFRDWIWTSSPLLNELAVHGTATHSGLSSYTAALTLGAFALWSFAALLPVPTFFLARLWLDRKTSLLAATMAALFPGTHFFNPATDQILPLLATGVLFLGAASLLRRSKKLAVLYGLLLCFAINFSLALGICGLIFILHGLFITWEIRHKERAGQLHRLVFFYFAIGAGTGAAILIGLLLFWGDLSLPNVIRLCLRNNATFNAVQSRSYLPWILASPIETAYSFGVPFFLVLVVSVCLARRRWGSGRAPVPPYASAALLSTLFVALLGINRGEVERLWLFLFPSLTVASLLILHALPWNSGKGRIPTVRSEADPHRFWTTVLVLQAIQTVVLRVSVDFMFSATRLAS